MANKLPTVWEIIASVHPNKVENRRWSGKVGNNAESRGGGWVSGREQGTGIDDKS